MNGDVFSVPRLVMAIIMTMMAGAVAWFGTAVIEVDRTQEAVLARLTEQAKHISEVSTIAQLRSADRFTGQNWLDKEAIIREQHNRIWETIRENRLHIDAIESRLSSCEQK